MQDFLVITVFNSFDQDYKAHNKELEHLDGAENSPAKKELATLLRKEKVHNVADSINKSHHLVD